MPVLNRPIRVLLIEDKREHMELLERLLAFSEFPKFSVTGATSLAGGIEKLSAGGNDIVLLDVSLPDSEGLDTFRRMNAAAPEVPIVILSGISDVTLAIEMVQEGAQDYLVKGHVDTHLLLRSIQYAIERKRSQVAALHLNAELEARVKGRTAELEAVNARIEREIGERRHAEEQLAKTNRQLTVAIAELRASRRRAAPEQSAALAREMDEVIKRVQQHTELLLRAPATAANPEKLTEHLRQISLAVDAGKKALRKTRESAAAAAMDLDDDGGESEIGPVLLDSLVERVVAGCTEKPAGQKAAESRIAFDLKLEKGVEIQGEERRLRLMLAHLVRNSMNAIPRRGKISIIVRQHDGEALVSVQDDGLGVTEAARQRLLDPSAAVDHPDGRASGYAVIHEVLARHGGRIEIESRKGIGTTVRAIFPSVKAAAEVERPRRVLVVDDDPMVREVISTYLNEDGYSVELAENGREALEKFCAGNFDIVLTDRSMPEMGGDEFAREVKRRNAGVPVVLLTGFGDIMAASGEKPEGVDVVMNKPFTMAGLHNTLAQFR